MIGKSYIINLNTRPDRLKSALAELWKIGVYPERFEAHTGDTPFLAFNSSQYHCIKKAFEEGWQHFTIYEDDVVFKDYGHAEQALNELPMDFDLFYLGANLIGSDIMNFKKPEKHSQHIYKLYDAWQTHAICYSRHAAEWILQHWDYTKAPTYDEWLRSVAFRFLNTYIIAPQICYQNPGHSDIWGTQVKTDHLFEQGNKLLL